MWAIFQITRELARLRNRESVNAFGQHRDRRRQDGQACHGVIGQISRGDKMQDRDFLAPLITSESILEMDS